MKIGKFMFGLGIGTTLGILFAPKKGKEMREELKYKSSNAINSVKDMHKDDIVQMINASVQDVKQAMDDFSIEEFKDEVSASLGAVKSKLEEIGNNIQNSSEYKQLKGSAKNMGEELGKKLKEIKTKMKDKNSNMDTVLQDIEDLDEHLDVIIEDMKD